MKKELPLWILLCAVFSSSASRGFAEFVNFETAPIHPIELGPDGRTLAVCNLPDGRIELFDVLTGVPASLGDVPVGVDPVSLRFRTTNELWVVNHISSSISIVDVKQKRIVATIDTLAGPSDIVFAGTPQRAFVSCSKVNMIQIFDPVTRMAITNVLVDGERPKAMAISPDGQRVYVAIFESGNGSTIVGAPLTDFEIPPQDVVTAEDNGIHAIIGNPYGPYGGQNPPPNSGAVFSPPINPAIPETNELPRVSQIVRKNNAGRWVDDNYGDWTEFISGTNAYLSGRIPGWDLPDHDLAVLDTETLKVSYVSGLMNICMDVAVNPASGGITVVGTDATNERRFESNLKGVFVRVNMALIDPATGQKSIHDLNPHLDYQTNTVPQSERDKSVGDPRGIVWNSSGTRGYLTGMGSRNLVILQGDGSRAQSIPVDLGEGPAGLALDEPRQRLYVLNRFSATISVVDTTTDTVVATVPFFDPTPAVIKDGRRHLYDTRRNSGLGQASCASCHVDGRMDRLAWDLGDPSGSLLTRSNALFGGGPFTFHPMKGPMVTQTFQDIIGHEPFHWRGDRLGIEEFNQTFTALLGRDSQLTDTEMQEFKSLLATIHFPPSLVRNLDDTLSTNVPLPGQFFDGRYGFRNGVQVLDSPGPALPTGNAVRGREVFRTLTFASDKACSQCHVAPTGLSRFKDGFNTELFGPNGERQLVLFALGRQDLLPFKSPQLRNLADKLGLSYSRTNSRSGFGFMHDGRVDTLSRLLLNGFDQASSLLFDGFFSSSPEQDVADVIAFLLSFSGSDPVDSGLPVVPNPDFVEVPALEVATSVGKQLTITQAVEVPLLGQMLAVAQSPSNRADLVVRGTKAGLKRGWVYDRLLKTFQSDRHDEVISHAALVALASPTNELTFTIVPRGSGRRIGVDRDNDGYFDRMELENGLDSEDSASPGTNSPPRLDELKSIGVHAEAPLTFAVRAINPDSPNQSLEFGLLGDIPVGATINPTNGLFSWLPTGAQVGTNYRFGVQVTDSVWPFLNDRKELAITVVPPLHASIRTWLSGGGQRRVVSIEFEPILGRTYRLEQKDSVDEPAWSEYDRPQRFDTSPAEFRPSFRFTPKGFFRIVLEE